MDSLVHRIQISLQSLKRNIESDRLNTESVITRPQMFLLYAIRIHGKCKLTQLAERVEVKPSAITVMIDRLEKAGFVKRMHDTVDRRSILVEVTPLGNDMLEKEIQTGNKILTNYLTRLDKEEILLLAELLEKMVGPEQS